MKHLSKLILYFREYDLYNNMLSNEIRDKKAKDVLLENCDFSFISANMATRKVDKILDVLKSKLKQNENAKKLIKSYVDDEVSLIDLFASLSFKSLKFLDDEKSKTDEIKRDRNFHIFYPVCLNHRKRIQQPLLTFSCELINDAFRINKVYANKNIFTLLIARQKNLEIADARALYETQLDEISSAVDALHESQSFLDLYQVICGEFKRIIGTELAKFQKTKDWQMLEKALISFEPPDKVIDNCFRDELETLERYYNKDHILPDTVQHFLGLSETNAINIENVDCTGFHLGSYHVKYPVNKKQWELMQLSRQSKLLCVEGPPGTGKTTLLKEMITDILIQKADTLLDVWNEEWTDLGADCKGVSRSPLLGKNLDSIIISSTNNKAIDNIGLDLLKEVPFFPDFAATIADEEQKYAGILCARLGNSDNTQNFYTSFFKNFCDYLESKIITDEEAETIRISYTELHTKLCSLNQEISDLLAFRAQFKSFSSLKDINARQHSLKEKVELLESQKIQYEGQISECRQTVSRIGDHLHVAKQNLMNIEQQMADLDEHLHMLYSDLKEYENISGVKRYLSFLFPKVRTIQRKYGSSEQIRDTIQEERDVRQKHQTHRNEISRDIAQKACEQDMETSELEVLESVLTKADTELNDISQQNESLSSYLERISLLAENEAFLGLDLLSADAYHLRNTPVIMKLRNRLFSAALRLFEAYIIMHKEPVLKNLGIILTENERSDGDGAYYNWCRALYNGDEPYPEEKAALVRILWETFFLCFPVVTTTLHSFRKSTFQFIPDLFDVLMLDESGQIVPYYVLAPLYRVRRAIFVGDINQIEPIKNVPVNMLGNKYMGILGDELYSRFCIDSASAQSYAAVTSDYYEKIRNKAGGVILNEHRRCEPSIMAFSNEHIYHNVLELIGDDDHNKLFDKNLVAFDVRGFKAQEHYNQAEIDACKQVVSLLIQKYGDNIKKDIGIITPFSRQAAKLGDAIPGVETGTVHVFQGAEKDFILFSSVIDSTTDMAGLYHFVGGKGNLLNVAFSRAKKQFIYIGNFQAARNVDNYLKLAMDVLTEHGRLFSLFDTQQLADSSFLADSSIIRILTGRQSTDADDEIGSYLHKRIPEDIIDTPRMHNEILKNVLLLSRSSVHIISPWIGSNVVTGGMLDTIWRKIQDSVSIHIIFGHKAVRCSLDDIDELVKKDIPWRKDDAANVIRSLKELLGDMLQFSPPSHVKLLLVDDKYLFIGSLNWLFNSGKTDQKEISCLITNSSTIAYVKERFLTDGN